jgi:formate/nitrite transporter FocA (FNT family)
VSSEVPQPEEIFARTKEEGRHRLERPLTELVSTAIAAGVDVVFGITAIGVASLAFAGRFGPDVGHFVGSLFFGIAFVFIVVGRSELFTENFLVPVAGLERTRRSWLKLVELWTVSPVFNLLGGMAMILVLTTHGVLPDGTGTPIMDLALKLDQNGFLAAFMSAVAAGALITMMTWLVEGQPSMGVRVAVAWMTGALVALGAFNHVIVVTLEMFYGIRFGSHVGWGDLFANMGTATLGNMFGGLVFVTLNRANQARGARSGHSAA